MSSFRNQAEAYAQALETGLLETQTVVAWADREIARSDIPPPPLIEVSLAGDDVNALVSALRGLPGEPDLLQASRLLLGHMGRALEKDPSLVEPIVEKLFRMAIDKALPEPEREDEVYAMEGILDSIQAGIGGDEEKLRRELERFLSRYA